MFKTYFLCIHTKNHCFLLWQLYKIITKDENWAGGTNHTTEEFKDKESCWC